MRNTASQLANGLKFLHMSQFAFRLNPQLRLGFQLRRSLTKLVDTSLRFPVEPSRKSNRASY